MEKLSLQQYQKRIYELFKESDEIFGYKPVITRYEVEQKYPTLEKAKEAYDKLSKLNFGEGESLAWYDQQNKLKLAEDSDWVSRKKKSSKIKPKRTVKKCKCKR